jgi:leader peptidase (prepilin peptidase)/N-methyltransferase
MVEAWQFGLVAFIFGICIGSFLNVVIYRLPMNRSLVSPGSHCPECGNPVRFYDNIPLVSWLLLFGLCRDCGVSISSRYFIIEGITGVLTMAVALTYGPTVEALLYGTLVWILIAVAAIDLEFQIIPDELSVGGFFFGMLAAWFLPVGVSGAIFGAFVGGGVFYALAILYPGGMGGGDIKLMAAIGAFLGWKLALLTIFFGSALGAVVGLVAIAFFGKGRKSRIPFGPFLSIGGITTILWGDQIVSWYLVTFL